MSNLKLFLELGEYSVVSKSTRVVSRNEFIGKYEKLSLGNGCSWGRRRAIDKTSYKFVTMKSNGKINFLWNKTERDQIYVKKLFSDCELGKKGNCIIYFAIVGEKDNINTNRPIRKDIKDEVIKRNC